MDPAVPVPHIRITQEWTHAATLLGCLNGTDWEVLLTIAHYTIAKGLDAAPIGVADFRARSKRSACTIEDSLKRLTRGPGDGGLGMVRVVFAQTASRARVLALETDWRAWGWEHADDLERARVALGGYRLPEPEPPPPSPPSAVAVELACVLRELCVGIVPVAEVPTVRDDDPVWDRWCRTMDGLLERRSVADLRLILRWVAQDKFWRGNVLGINADLRVKRHIDRFHALTQVHLEKVRGLRT